MKYLLFLVFLGFSTQFLFAEKDSTRAYDVNPVVVTGTRMEVNRNNVTMTVSQISKSEIDESAESAILPILSSRVPGLFVTERGVTGFGVAGGAAGGIKIRGVGGSPNTDVLILIDGHPQYMGIMGHPLPDAYVASDAQKVEVIRGPASVLYGSNAMGGVINIITRQQESKGIALNASSQYGSFNTLKANGGIGYSSDKFDTYFSINHDRTDGHREGSDFDILNGYFKSNYYINQNFNIMVDANLADFKAFNPGPITAPYGADSNWVDILRGKAALSLNNKIGAFTGALKLFYNFGEHVIFDGFQSNDHNYGITFYQGLDLFDNTNLTVGVDYKNIGGFAENVFAMNGNGITFVDTTLYEIGSYVYLQQRLLDNIVLNGGLRVDNHSVYGTELVPQFGAVYNPVEGTTTKFSISKGYRNPTIRELFMWAPANPELEAQRMLNYELGFAQSFLDRRLNLELTGFISNGDNMIVMNGVFPDVRYENTGSFAHRGIEFEAKASLYKNVFFHATYSYLNMDAPQLAAPENQVFTELVWLPSIFRFSFSTQYINNLYTQLENAARGIEATTEDYLLLNISANASINKWLDIFIKAENLLDTQYTINQGYPMPGFTVFGGVRVNYR